MDLIIISLKINLFSPLHISKFVVLALSNNYPLTRYIRQFTPLYPFLWWIHFLVVVNLTLLIIQITTQIQRGVFYNGRVLSLFSKYNSDCSGGFSCLFLLTEFWIETCNPVIFLHIYQTMARTWISKFKCRGLFLCSMIWCEKWSFVLLILMELLIITV